MTSTILQLSEPFGRVAYRVAGQGAPVLLIHGVGMQSAAWGPQMDALSATHRVIALDMPGHGGSDPVAADADLPVFVAWLDAVLTALGLGPVNLAGHSMGAMIAGGYAACHPDKVARVALLNGVFCRSPEARQAVIARAEDIRKGRFDLQTPLKRWFGDSPIEQAALDKVAGWLSSVDNDGYATAYAAFAAGDSTYADRFSSIACPLLALTADGDPNSTPAMAHAMAEAAQNGRAVVLAGHRHMVNLTDPDAVTDALREWLETPAAGKDAA
ncbi:alpha/beta hydrolase [Aliisedimentitalea scapharcae]|uniref:Alpha/beta hydrolase n=1 Tax=Aliisedimentitalea scapharcae TaxID=1524259 RepID=A0ABZ2XVQ6_9RHOB